MNIHRYHCELAALRASADTVEEIIEALRFNILEDSREEAMDLLEDATLLTVAAGLLRQVTKTFEAVERGAGRARKSETTP